MYKQWWLIIMAVAIVMPMKSPKPLQFEMESKLNL